MTFHQRVELILHVVFAEVHHRFTVGFLVTGEGHGIDRKRILLRGGDLLFQQTANHARFGGA
ncbi:hypothetical protein D3C75_1328120 [compost metagenome]